MRSVAAPTKAPKRVRLTAKAHPPASLAWLEEATENFALLRSMFDEGLRKLTGDRRRAGSPMRETR